MGYGERQKGYRLYDLTVCEKVIHSRDVFFNESSMSGIQKEQNGNAGKYVELEIEDDPVAEDSNPTEVASPENGQPAEEIQVEPPTTFDPPLRRSSRIRSEPDWYGYNHGGLIASGKQQDPSTVAEALSKL